MMLHKIFKASIFCVGMEAGVQKEKGLMGELRANPWMLATVVLGVLFLVTLFNSTSGGGFGEASSSKVGEDVVAYLNGQTGGGVVLQSVEKENGLYKVTVTYQGQDVPMYATLDGKNLVPQVTPLDGSVVGGSDVPTAPTVVDIDENKLVGVPMKGDVNAPVTVIEFSDFQCPYCEKAYSDAVKGIEENYVKSGKVKFYYMNFPLSFHPEAMPAANAALCFEKVKGGSDVEFYKYHDKLFENQGSLSDANYKKWARELGANGAQFDACQSAMEFEDKINAEMAYGSQLGVTGTPGFFVNGVFLEGAYPYAQFETLIEEELAKTA